MSDSESAGSPFRQQVGGSHYKDFKIQPVEYILANKIGFCEGNVIKYVTRYAAKGGVQDLKKAKHYIELLIASMGEGVPDATSANDQGDGQAVHTDAVSLGEEQRRLRPSPNSREDDPS